MENNRMQYVHNILISMPGSQLTVASTCTYHCGSKDNHHIRDQRRLQITRRCFHEGKDIQSLLAKCNENMTDIVTRITKQEPFSCREEAVITVCQDDSLGESTV